jgi:hypothetical protein
MKTKAISDVLNDIDSNRLHKSFDIAELEANDPFYVDKTADWLVGELGPKILRTYCCKVARYMPRAYLSNLITVAKEKGDTPVKLFCYLCERRLKQLGVAKSDA